VRERGTVQISEDEWLAVLFPSKIKSLKDYTGEVFRMVTGYFDTSLAADLIGKRILIGITYLNADGDLESQQQLHGIVECASETEGVLIKLQGVYAGKELSLPPDTSAISRAEPGIYRLRATGEEVENPDYLCTWEVHQPRDGGAEPVS